MSTSLQFALEYGGGQVCIEPVANEKPHWEKSGVGGVYVLLNVDDVRAHRVRTGRFQQNQREYKDKERG